MRNTPTKTPPSLSPTFLDTSSLPTPSTIHLVSQYLSSHLPPELVDQILSLAEFWAHSTTTLSEPVRAFGPFTWGWREGDGIDYLNVWCPSGPGYAHRWRRWGESRRDDGFLVRSGGIGVLEEDGEGGGGGCKERYLKKSRLAKTMLSLLYRKGGSAGLRMPCRRRCQTKKKGERRELTNSIFPSSRTAAVRKIVFEMWSHQDYFGAVGDSTADDDGAQQSVRVFCDVSINRKRDATPHSARWRGRIFRWRRGGDAVDSSNENDDDDNNDKKSGKHGKLIAYKPFILENSDTPRYYFPRDQVHTWRWDDTSTPSNTPPNDHQAFPTAQEFLRQIEVGDTIGVWGRVGKGETYHIIDAMRMHVFWAV